jgi:hypothetical protein
MKLILRVVLCGVKLGPRKIFRPKTDQVAKDWAKLHREEFLISTVRVTESRIKWEGM